jgi:hypothetical protein
VTAIGSDLTGEISWIAPETGRARASRQVWQAIGAMTEPGTKRAEAHVGGRIPAVAEWSRIRQRTDCVDGLAAGCAGDAGSLPPCPGTRGLCGSGGEVIIVGFIGQVPGTHTGSKGNALR